MSAMWALFWALFGFAMLTIYVSVATALAVVVRRRTMEITCKKDVSTRDDHLYCSSLTGHWFGPVIGGILWPLAIAPLLILSKLHRDEVSLARIDHMERELGMRR